MNRKTYRVIELFSGIGSQAKALSNLGIQTHILNTCEWNIHACMAYERIHMSDSPINCFPGNKDALIDYFLNLGVSNDGKSVMNRTALQSISESALRAIYSSVINTRNLVDISRIHGEDIDPFIDIMTYSFPCQDLSIVGAFHGNQKGIDRDAHNQSSLLWQVERILYERRKEDMYMPHFLIMENVPALNSSRHRGNFEEWQKQLVKLGYINKQYVLNARDFGIPQNRERLFMVSILSEGDKDIEKDILKYFESHRLDSGDYRRELGIHKGKLSEFLRTDYTNPIYYSEAIESQPNDTASRKRIWEDNVQLTDEKGRIRDDLVTGTLTTKQDRHPNAGNIGVSFNNNKAEFRYLTPRECFLLMGFSEEDYDNVIKGNIKLKANTDMFTRDNLVKMAGNSIAVNVLEYIFTQIIEIDRLLFL